MFTGIIQHVGVVQSPPLARGGGPGRLIVAVAGWQPPGGPFTAGESIAVNGCCLTLTEADETAVLQFDIIAQTLACTTLGELREASRVNLERAATPSTLLGGHIVQGHVDGVGVVSRVSHSPAEHRLRIEPPAELLDYIIDKGSIALDGVSLTIAAVGDAWFEVALIPTTLEHTTLGDFAEGWRVNLEADYVAKVIAHQLRRNR